LEDFKIAVPKPNRLVIELKMTWHGAVTRSKFTSDVKLTLDTAEKDAWEVLDVEYKDDNVMPKLKLDKHLKELKADLNR
jgi:hypothetical protein